MPLHDLLRVERLSEPVVIPVWLCVMRDERHHEREVVDEREQDRLDDVLHAAVVGKCATALNFDKGEPSVVVDKYRVGLHCAEAFVALPVQIRNLRVVLARLKVPSLEEAIRPSRR